ncbi:MAG: AMP-binding protein, partial [Caulobacteraceae bacterium]
MNGNLYALLASRFPGDRRKPAFETLGGGSLSYADLEAGAARLAALLKAKSVAPGDRVAVQSPKSLQAVMLYLAVLKAGGAYLPLNTAYTKTEIDYFLADAEPALFVTDAEALAREANGLTPLEAAHDASASDLAAIVYTSGTTGRSKGAMLSHGALAANGLALTEAWGFTGADTLLHALPIYHVHGLFIALHCVFLAGAKALWLAKFDEDQVLAALGRSTVMMGVPTYYTRLLADPRFGPEACKAMRLFISGSAPLLPATFDEFEARAGMRLL